jgi:hypothetical protein
MFKNYDKINTWFFKKNCLNNISEELNEWICAG